MKHTCDVCNQEFSTSFNLRRHKDRRHTVDNDMLNPYTKHLVANQKGGGIVDGAEGDTSSDTISDTSSINNSDSSSKTDESDTETDDHTGKCFGKESESDENWVFDQFMEFTPEEGVPWTLQEKREEFRSNYSRFLEWYSHLKKNAIHRKVMTTAKNLETDDGDYDRQEALSLAVEKRRFLLDRLVDDDDSDEDDEEAEDEDTSFSNV